MNDEQSMVFGAHVVEALRQKPTSHDMRTGLGTFGDLVTGEIDPAGLATQRRIQQTRADIYTVGTQPTKAMRDRAFVNKGLRMAEVRQERDRLDAAQEVYEWLVGDLTLQANECSRLHKFAEAMLSGDVCDIEYFSEGPEAAYAMRDDGDPVFLNAGFGNPTVLEGCESFVVRHDWAKIVHLDDNLTTPFPLPAPFACFEFKISGRTCLYFLRSLDAGSKADATVLVESHGQWVTPLTAAGTPLFVMCDRQVRAACIALDAKVIEQEVVRAPIALQAKRAKTGKLPLYDFRILDISRRGRRAAPSGNPVATGGHKRLHFRRGHWRNFEHSGHRTWINWMLVGDPDLGFVDKEYRL